MRKDEEMEMEIKKVGLVVDGHECCGGWEGRKIPGNLGPFKGISEGNSPARRPKPIGQENIEGLSWARLVLVRAVGTTPKACLVLGRPQLLSNM